MYRMHAPNCMKYITILARAVGWYGDVVYVNLKSNIFIDKMFI